MLRRLGRVGSKHAHFPLRGKFAPTLRHRSPALNMKLYCFYRAGSVPAPAPHGFLTRLSRTAESIFTRTAPQSRHPLRFNIARGERQESMRAHRLARSVVLARAQDCKAHRTGLDPTRPNRRIYFMRTALQSSCPRIWLFQEEFICFTTTTRSTRLVVDFIKGFK